MTTNTEAMNFWTENPQFAEGASPYMSADQKTVLVESKRPFLIVGVQYDPDNEFRGKSNPRWLFTVDLGEEWYLLALSDNPRRRALAEAMAGHIRQHGSVTAILTYIDMDNGQGFYNLEPPEES